eukprot:Polyplicarium_translucidae@DN3051_c1_g1_i1.p1
MAKHAEKKLQRAAATTRQMHSTAALAVSVVFAIVRLGLRWRTASLSIWILFAVSSAIHVVTFSGISSAALQGVSYGLWQDLFLLNAVTEAMAGLLSDRWWWLWLAAPGYGAYKAGRYVVAWARSGSDEPSPEEEARAAKKKRKMEKKLQTGRAVLVRHRD